MKKLYFCFLITWTSGLALSTIQGSHGVDQRVVNCTWQRWTRCTQSGGVCVRRRLRTCNTTLGGPALSPGPAMETALFYFNPQLGPKSVASLKPAQVQLPRSSEPVSVSFTCKCHRGVKKDVLISLTVFYKNHTSVLLRPQKNACRQKASWKLSIDLTVQFVRCYIESSGYGYIARMDSSVVSGIIPEVQAKTSAMKLYPRDTVTIECSVVNQAEGLIWRWARLDGRPLPVNHEMTTHKDTRSASLTMTVLPSGDIAVDDGQPCKISCHVISYPPAEVLWFKVDTGRGNIPQTQQLLEFNQSLSESSALLEFRTFKNSDSGEYFCFARNRFKAVKQSLQLTVSNSSEQSKENIALGGVSEDTRVSSEYDSNESTSTETEPGSKKTTSTTTPEPTTTTITTTEPTTTEETTTLTTITTTLPTTTEEPTTTTTEQTTTEPTSTTTEQTTTEETTTEEMTTRHSFSLWSSQEVVTATNTNEKCDCGPGRILCTNSRCIPVSQFCDGEDNCGDNSDEWNCRKLGHKYPCAHNEFLCRHPLKRCLDDDLFGDGYKNCEDGSDESEHSQKCRKTLV